MESETLDLSQIENDVSVFLSNWHTRTIALCKTGRQKWYKLAHSMDHTCSPLKQYHATRWKLDEREGPLRMKMRLQDITVSMMIMDLLPQ